MAEALSGIYGILPDGLDREELLARAWAALRGGVRILQLRDKSSSFEEILERARMLRDLTSHYGARLIINDSLQIALEVGADGVHLGPGDGYAELLPIREQLAEQILIGISCKGDMGLARFALDHGADYLSFGAIWATRSKPEASAIGLARLHQARRTFPAANICAIGGITRDRLAKVKAAGANCAAIISGLFAAEDIEAEARALVEAWEKA